MRVSYFELMIAQTLSLIANTKLRSYDTKRIYDHLNELESITEKLSQFNMNSLSPASFSELYKTLSYVRMCLEYITGSTVYDLPLEIHYAMRSIAEEWLDNPDEYIFVSNEGDFAITSYNDISNLHSIIEHVTGIRPSHKLVYFSVPAYLKNDFICNNAMYHEKGHFVDYIIRVVDPIVEEYDLGIAPIPKTEFFNNETDIKKIRSYLGEYFADLFAAQYMGKNAYAYLIRNGVRNDFGEKHPSHEKRVAVVDDFVDSKTNIIIDLLSASCKKKGRELKLRLQTIDISGMIKGQFYPMTKSSDIHALICSGWDLWFNCRGNFKNPDGSVMHYTKVYNTINSCIQQSVEDFKRRNNP